MRDVLVPLPAWAAVVALLCVACEDQRLLDEVAAGESDFTVGDLTLDGRPPRAGTGGPLVTTIGGLPSDAGSGNCTGTIGFWANHAELWPVRRLELGDRTYTLHELLKILDSEPRGDVSVQLARQLISTKLAIARGADDGDVAATVEAADQWLIEHDDGDGIPLGVPSESEANALIEALTTYNNGDTGLEHC